MCSHQVANGGIEYDLYKWEVLRTINIGHNSDSLSMAYAICEVCMHSCMHVEIKIRVSS